MHAAVVRSFDHLPVTRRATRPGQAGRMRSRPRCSPLGCTLGSAAMPRAVTTPAAGTLPMIPGIDGVGRLPDGRRVYFVVADGIGDLWRSEWWLTCGGPSTSERMSKRSR